MRKVIVVFANSVKHGKHCVAGKDVQSKQWIRPVGDAGGSELDHDQCVSFNPYGQYPVKPLQKVEIDISSHAPLLNQPENHIIGDGRWNQRYKIEPAEVSQYLDSPDSLWGIGNKVDYSFIESGSIKIDQSLYLVKVNELKIYKNMENKRRASFSYNGHRYDLPVTDPNFERLLNNPQHQEVLCVSLGEKYDPMGGENYSCYKIVATII